MSYPDSRTTVAAPTPTANDTVASAAVIAQLARDGVPRHQLLAGDSAIAPRLVWPDKSVTDMEGTLPKPLRKRGHAALVDPESFAAYVNSFKDTGTDRERRGVEGTSVV